LEKAKPFEIPKKLLWEAYQLIKSNGGAAGIDGQTIEGFEECLKDNLYKLWNRMSSGSYHPQAVRRVEIPKKSGGMRPLGIPSVTDRIAQMAAKMVFEPLLEAHFHEDSYGYRPNKSAHQALEKARERCWRNDWVIDLDIKAFFDTIDPELMMKAVRKHAPPRWVELYIQRWLKAPAQDAQGTIYVRDKGTPQGGVASPLLANLYLHYAFDMWMKRMHPDIGFERYADDIVIHCRSLAEAQELKREIERRLAECKLAVNQEKTRIIYCKDSNRTGKYEQTEFDFLGYSFQPRFVRSKQGKYFIGFTPAISRKAEKAIRDEMRSWKMHLRTDKDLGYLSGVFNPKLRGWIQYYGKFRISALRGVCKMFQRILVKWAKKKFKRLKQSWARAWNLVEKISRMEPTLFIHWELGMCK
jgi:group II intron reverse transcriptase/maturase